MVARAKSKGELLAHLKTRGVEDDVAQAIIFRLQEAGLVNDLDFARAWAQSRHTHKKISKRVISTELRQKGVVQEFIDCALEEIDEDAEFSTALALAEKKFQSLSRYESEVQIRRIQSLLARKGYGFPTISRVLQELNIISE